MIAPENSITYTMSRIVKYSSKTLIFTGIIFILGGIFGYFFVDPTSAPAEIKTRHRFTEQSASFAFVDNGIGEPTANILSGHPADIGILPETNNRSQSIVPGAFYVHTANDLLEFPEIPDRLSIPAINLVAPIIISDFNLAKVEGETFGQWVAPSKFAAGWHPDSALLGQKGNTVINGHHNEYGEVFGKLVDLEIGDLIVVRSGDKEYHFVVANKMILAERFQPTEIRMENARWLGKTDDVRLTLVTCYPKETNTHRLIIVARLVEN